MSGRPARRSGGFILLPVALLLALVAATAFLGHRETALSSAQAQGSGDADKARYAAEAGLHRAIVQMHGKGCGGSYPVPLFGPVKDTAFDGASYYASAWPLSGSPVEITSVGSYGDATITLTRSNVPMHQASAVTMTLQPASEGIDSYLVAGSTAGNASKPTLLGTPGSAYPVLRFNLSAIPSGSHVTSATLSTYAEAGSGTGPVALHRLLRDWTPDVNWTTSDGSSAWASVGGDLHPSAVATASFGGAGRWLDWDITGLADRWLKGSVPNQGVQIRPGAPISSLTLTSSDGNTAAQRPRLAVTFLPPCGWTPPGTTVTLAPTADTDIDSGALTLLQNFGAQPDLYLSEGTLARPLLRFDLSGIAAGKTVRSATLRLYLGAVTVAGLQATKTSKTLTLDVHAVSKAWEELQATWLKRLTSKSWAASGGDYAGTAIASRSLPGGSASGQWIEFTLTSQVQDWVDDAKANNGVILLLPTNSTEELIFNSREAAGNRPELIVTYE